MTFTALFPTKPLPPALTHPLRCRSCDRGMTPRPLAGQTPQATSYHGRGLCQTCYRRHHRRGTLDKFDQVATDGAYQVPARQRSGEYGKFQLRQSHLVTGEPMTAKDARDRRLAALTVCAHSDTAADAADVLLTLGLIEKGTS